MNTQYQKKDLNLKCKGRHHSLIPYKYKSKWYEVQNEHETDHFTWKLAKTREFNKNFVSF